MAAAYPTTYRSTLLAAKTGTNPRPCGGQRPSSPGKPCSSLSTILKRREQLHEIFIPSEGIDKHFFREHFKSYFGDTVEWREGTHSNTGVEGYVLKSAKEIVISDGMIRALRIHSRDHRRQRLEVARSGYFGKEGT